MSTLFRQRAVAGQASADTLDAPVNIVRIPAWAALILGVLLLAGFAVWLSLGTVAVTTEGSGVVLNAPANAMVTASSSGVLIQAPPPAGTSVRAGEVVGRIVEAGEEGPTVIREVLAPVTGTVVAVGVGADVYVDFGVYLATVAPATDVQTGYLYVPAQEGEQIRPGDKTLLAPNSVDATSAGLLIGQVAAVSPLPVAESRIRYITGDPAYTAELVKEGPLVEVQVQLQADPATPTGWSWTQFPGPAEHLVSGIPTHGIVVLAEVPPYRAFFGSN